MTRVRRFATNQYSMTRRGFVHGVCLLEILLLVGIIVVVGAHRIGEYDLQSATIRTTVAVGPVTLWQSVEETPASILLQNEHVPLANPAWTTMDDHRLFSGHRPTYLAKGAMLSINWIAAEYERVGLARGTAVGGIQHALKMMRDGDIPIVEVDREQRTMRILSTSTDKEVWKAAAPGNGG